MKVFAPFNPPTHAWAVHLSQMTGRVAAHRSSPTDRPVDPVGALNSDTLARQPSRHTFDIRV